MAIMFDNHPFAARFGSRQPANSVMLRGRRWLCQHADRGATGNDASCDSQGARHEFASLLA
jgi:hypothetical protein